VWRGGNITLHAEESRFSAKHLVEAICRCGATR
jgi:hypothetical protein